MKLSVVLPCYNGAATLAVQLEALARQTHDGPWELVVSNNGSTDDSMEIVARYHGRIPVVRIVQAHVPPDPHLGVAHSYNVGVGAAEGDAFVFCESDDEVADGWLGAMASALERHPFVVGALEYDRLNTRDIVGEKPGLQEEGFGRSPDVPHGLLLAGCNVGMRREVWARVGPADETMPVSWDTDYIERVQAAGFPVHFARDAVIHYRLRADPRGAFRQQYRFGLDSARLRQKHVGEVPPVRWGWRLARMGLGMAVDTARAALRSELTNRRFQATMGYRLGQLEGLFRYRA